MTAGADGIPLARVLVHVHRTAQGAMWLQVEALTPAQDLGRVPLGDLPILLEALVADAGT